MALLIFEIRNYTNCFQQVSLHPVRLRFPRRTLPAPARGSQGPHANDQLDYQVGLRSLISDLLIFDLRSYLSIIEGDHAPEEDLEQAVPVLMKRVRQFASVLPGVEGVSFCKLLCVLELKVKC